MAIAALAGCGEKSGPGASSTSDAQVAAQIRASAAERARERDQQARAAEAKQQARTTAIDASEALPAGTEELYGTAAATSAPAAGGLLSAADRASFARLGAKLAGQEGVAVSTIGLGRPVSRAGGLRAGVAWSTAKAPVAMAAITAGVGTRSDLVQAITASDNAAAERLWSALGEGARAAGAATAQLRVAGDQRTVIEGRRLRPGYTAFGQTMWSLTDQARFAAGMTCTAAGGRVLDLMGQVVAGQRWGLGSTGNPARFKGGWGPGITSGNGDGWLDRQMGVLTIKGKPIAVAIATTAGSHGAGTQNLTTIARWVATHVDVKHVSRRPAC
jgi:hypothetical protein